MGCDIHSFSERKVNELWEELDFSPFAWRSYGMYGFLADVRNHSAVPPIAKRRGLPEDASDEVRSSLSGDRDIHSVSWLSIKELQEFDYDRPVEDRRVLRKLSPNLISDAVTADPGGGEMTTYREFLGEEFFHDLNKLKEIGAERIVFGFDN